MEYIEGKIYKIDIEKIEFGINPKKFNEKDAEHVAEITRLAQLIKEYGQLQPIDITPFYKNGGTVIIGRDALKIKDWEKQKKQFVRLDGERRMRAKRDILGEKQIDALIKLRLTLKEFTDAKWITCAKKTDMNPYDMAIAVKEFKEQHPDLMNPYQRLAELTGWSATYFKDRDEINNAGEALQKIIAEDKSKANVPAEIKHNIPNRFKWRKIAEEVHIKERKKASTLFMRSVKPRIQQAEQDCIDGKITEKELEEQGNSLIRNKGKLTKELLPKPDFPLYEREIRDFIYQLRRWNMGTKADLERHKKINGLFQELMATWHTQLCEIYPDDRRGIFGPMMKRH